MEKFETYPLISVVIPTYNRVQLLLKAIGSVLSQSYSNIEVIIVDDGSTDWTKRAILSIEDPRLIYHEIPHSGHIGKVRNAGAAIAKGEWLAFLDSDDMWTPRKLEWQMESIRDSGKRWCYGKFELMDEHGKTIPPKVGVYKPASGWVAEQLLTNEVAVVICTLLLEKKLFDEISGFSTDNRLAFRGDYEFALRLALKEQAVALPNTLVRVLEHEGRSTRSLEYAYENSLVPYSIFLEEQHDDKLKRIARKRRAWLLSEAAVNRSARGNLRMAFTQLSGSIRYDGWRHWFSALYRSVKAMVTGKKQLVNPTPTN